MARSTVYSLALRVTGDTSRLNLTPAERALQNLGKQADQVTSVFDRFSTQSEAAGRAQEQFAGRLQTLQASLQSVGAEQFAENFAQIKAEAEAAAAVFERGAQTAARFATEQEKSAASIGRLGEELRLGAIEAPVFERALQSLASVDFAATEEGRRAIEELSRQAREGTLDVDAAAATLQRLAERQQSYTEAQQRAAQLVGTLVTAEERRASQAEEYNSLLQQGLITEEQRVALLQQLGPITDAARQAEATLASDRERARQIIESLVTPQERYQSSVEQLDRLLQQNLISQEQYNQALAQAQVTLDNASGASAAAAEAEARRVASQREGAAVAASVQTAEERRVERIADLDRLLAENAITQETYNRALDQANGVQEAAARAEQDRQRVLEEGRRITDQFASVEERRADQLADLQRLLDAGAISEQTFARASAEASGANEAAARAERERADALAEASRIIQANLTPQERYDAAIVELQGHLEAGRLSQEQFNRAADRARQDLDRSTGAAQNNDKALQGIARQLRIISSIEIGRVLVDSFRAIANVTRNLSGRLDALVDSVRQSLDEIDKLSLRTGISREALQGYGVAAELAGVSTDQLGATLQRLTASIGRATPPAELTQGLRQLGLTVQELRGLAPEDQFSLIAQRISELPTATQRAGAAFGVLGEQGVRLTSLLQQQGNAIEEVRQRSERLGIIVRDDQIANVTELNDTFTLVQRTIEGIIGQVSGNLAPLVTAIANEFLAFVEGFEGIESTGGTALADRITDSLLTGAEFVAGVFDTFVEQFGGFAGVIEAAGNAFSTTANVFTIVYEGLRTIFNTFQISIDGFLINFGKALETLGGYLSTDLAEFGAGLVAASQASLRQNTEELLDAAKGVGEATTNLFSGSQPEEAAAGQAELFIRSMREKIEQARSPEFRVQTNIDNTREQFDAFFNGLVDQTSQVTVLMRDFEAAVAAAQEDGELTVEEIAKIEQLQKRVNAAIQQELAARNEAVAAAAKQAEADSKRVDALLQTTDAASKVAQDLAAVEREIARVQQQIAETGVADDGSAAARLQQLQTLQNQLTTQLEASAQGFTQGFDVAFADVGRRFADLSDQAAEFGNAGAEAADRLRAGIEAAQQQAEAGILNREAFDREVQRQEQLFQQELQNVRAIADERQRVNQLVDERFALARFGGDQQRLQAAQNLAQLEREIGRVQQEVRAARAAGENEAAAAGAARLAQLDQVAAQERDIASGRRQLEEQINQQRQQALQAIQQQQQAAEEQQKKIREEQEKAAEAEFQRQAERIRDLNTLGSGVISGTDIRTSEGASLFLQLASQRQDPALIEARLQTRRLTEIIREIERLTGLPVITFP